MSESHPCDGADQTWRISNGELQTLMASLTAGDQGAVQKLFRAITPLLAAFYDGQAQAGRLDPDEVGHLVQLALLALYRKRAGYPAEQPFRAWLIDVARSTMVGPHSHARAGKPSMLRGHLRVSPTQAQEPERLLHEVQIAWLVNA